jgi:hypothetical protein
MGGSPRRSRALIVAMGLASVLAMARLGFARQDGGFTRVKEGDGGASVRLEMSVREFAKKDGGPKVYLAAAVHIGEAEFYKHLQEFLDAQDVVLFEGVKPPGAGAAEHDQRELTDQDRVDATRHRIRFLAMAVDRYRNEHKKMPASLAELAFETGGRIGSLLKSSTSDAWGRGIELWVNQAGGENRDGFDLVSFGADGQPAGMGVDADIFFSEQQPLSKSEKGDRTDGIQTKLAEATGLVFQLSAMNSDGRNWRNSDLAMDQVQARLDKAGADGGMLFKMLDGSSVFSKIGSLLLGLVGSTPEGKAMLRVMLIEMLGHADVLIQQAPGGLGKLMDVILEDRNEVVIADLQRIIETEKDVKSIAVIYGAGHLPGIQKGIERLGYEVVGDQWFTAMRANAKEAGISEKQFKATRDMVSRMVEAQVKKTK